MFQDLQKIKKPFVSLCEGTRLLGGHMGTPAGSLPQMCAIPTGDYWNTANASQSLIPSEGD